MIVSALWTKRVKNAPLTKKSWRPFSIRATKRKWYVMPDWNVRLWDWSCKAKVTDERWYCRFNYWSYLVPALKLFWTNADEPPAITIYVLQEPIDQKTFTWGFLSIKWLLIEDGCIQGGFGSAVLEFLCCWS
jgi:hypothetical protein